MRLGKTYSPTFPVVALFSMPVSTFLRVTWAPGTTAFCESDTVPRIVLLIVVCPIRQDDTRVDARKAQRIFLLMFNMPFSFPAILHPSHRHRHASQQSFRGRRTNPAFNQRLFRVTGSNFQTEP